MKYHFEHKSSKKSEFDRNICIFVDPSRLDAISQNVAPDLLSLQTDLCDVCFNASHLYIANIVKKTLPTNCNFDYNCLIIRD